MTLSPLPSTRTSDHIIAMRKVLSFALLLAAAGCSTPARWEKPGVSAEMTATDAVDCRRAASQEAFLYPSGFPPPLWPYRRGQPLTWEQYQGSERFYAENRLTAFCMRNKGYEQVPIPKPQG
jgi:hypothetical protein